MQIGFRSGDRQGKRIKFGGALIILNMPVDVGSFRDRRNDVDALSRLASRHRPGQEPHLRERPVERSGALSLVILPVTIKPAPISVALDQIVVVFEDIDLGSGVGSLPGDGAGEGMKFDSGLRVSNLIESVRDVDDADVLALVRNFVFFGGDDERVAFYRATFVEIT